MKRKNKILMLLRRIDHKLTLFIDYQRRVNTTNGYPTIKDIDESSIYPSNMITQDLTPKFTYRGPYQPVYPTDHRHMDELFRKLVKTTNKVASRSDDIESVDEKIYHVNRDIALGLAHSQNLDEHRERWLSMLLEIFPTILNDDPNLGTRFEDPKRNDH